MGNRFYAWCHRHYKLAWLLAILPLIYLAQDRQPPLHIIHYTEPTPVHAGEDVHFDLVIDRDDERRCDAEVSRQFLLSTGSTRPYIQKEIFSADQIAQNDLISPSRLQRDFPVPANLPAGRTVLQSEIVYRCHSNPLHILWPVHMYLEWPFTILPGKAP